MKAIVCQRLAWIVALACLAGCNKARDSETELPVAEPPAASKVTLEELKTADWDAILAEHLGKIVVVDTWATWCAPCVEEFPKLVALHEDYSDQEVACVSVSADGAGAHDAAAKFLEGQQATFTNYRLADSAEQEAWWEKWDLKSIPAVLVFDREGKLARKFDMDDPDNQFTYDEVEALVAELVESN